jgi:hypothetical protein
MPRKQRASTVAASLQDCGQAMDEYATYHSTANRLRLLIELDRWPDAALPKLNVTRSDIAEYQRLYQDHRGLEPGIRKETEDAIDRLDRLAMELGETSEPLQRLKGALKQPTSTAIEDVRRLIVRLHERAAKAKGKAQAPPPDADHNDDYTSARWNDEVFYFNKAQAQAVEMLWEAWEKGGLSVSQKKIGAKLRTNDANYRLIFTFRQRDGTMHPAWEVMIVPAPTPGSFMLAPEKSENHESRYRTRTPARRKSGHGKRPTTSKSA